MNLIKTNLWIQEFEKPLKVLVFNKSERTCASPKEHSELSVQHLLLIGTLPLLVGSGQLDHRIGGRGSRLRLCL